MSSQTTSEAPNPLRFVSRDRVCTLIDCTANHLEHLARTDPTFPRAIKLGAAFNSPKRWAEHEVIAWMQARLDARGAELTKATEYGRKLQTRQTRLVPRRKPATAVLAAPSTLAAS